jgi:serine/threonine protein kinase
MVQEKELMIPDVLAGRYAIQQQLGNQTGRKTFLATDLETHTPVVIKVLLLGDDFEWQALKLFEREAQTLKTLDHPAIPRYLDYLELDEPNGFALIQTYVQGRSLEEHLKAGRTFSEIEVETLARSLLEILIYLQEHEPPIIHRDIKPSNILLTDRSGNSPGKVYLVDFGSVQTIAAQTGGTITVVGTYGYMPPEQFGGRVSPASDLYSLGATLIYLLTGRHPTELPQSNFQIQFRQLIQIRSEFADWLEWMTEPALNRRFTSATGALQAINNPLPRRTSITLPRSLSIPTDRITSREVSSNLIIRVHQGGADFLKLTLISVGGLLGFWVTIGAFCGFSTSVSLSAPIFLGMGAIALLIFLPLFQHQEFTVTPTKLTWRSLLLGLKWNRVPPLSTPSITQIQLTYQHIDGVRRAVKLTITSELHQLVLDHRHLSDVELVWMAQQLSQWLQKPLIETND